MEGPCGSNGCFTENRVDTAGHLSTQLIKLHLILHFDFDFIKNQSVMGRVWITVLVSMLLMFLPKKCNGIPRSNFTDQSALLAFKAHITFDPQNILAREWSTKTSFCNWTGVSCSLRRQRVTELDLSSMGLVGTVPPQLGNLSFLQYLTLYNNSFHGYLPSEIGNLRRLQILDIGSNKLPLVIPESFGNLHKLEELRFDGNDLTELKSLWLPYNNFTGAIPEEIGSLPMLELNLGVNMLSGDLPRSIFNMTSIKRIILPFNRLSGSMPQESSINLPNLKELQLNMNDITGSMPGFLRNLSRLEILDLSFNKMTGNVLQEFGNLRALQGLFLEYNSFTNHPSSQTLDFITSLTNCRQLKKLHIGDNPLDGMLPNSVGNLSRFLTNFHAYTSKLKGHIPVEIGNLSSLIVLSLQENSLVGPIPTTVRGLRKIQVLDLYKNKLNGSIPSDVCLARRLVDLTLDNNLLSGEIPSCLGNLTSLRNLYLHFNKLSSAIPMALWSLKDLLILNLHSNFLYGSIPPQIGEMEAAIGIRLSSNQLSGNIPSTIGSLQKLIKFSLSQNSFQGSIPEAFGELTSLELLDLSQNNLSGEIPKSLEALRYLKYFNASFNGLQGEIPRGGPFANFTASSFIMNKGLCGPSRLQVPPCSIESRKDSKTKSRLLRFSLPAAASFLLVVAFIFLVMGCRRRYRKDPIPEALPVTAIQRRISYLELLRATNEFHETNLLGTGSFGSVYQGRLPDGLNVAVKIFNLQLQRAFRSFDTECEILRNIRHRNLVKIICSCSNLDFKALVLEYMPKGSLEKWLYSHNYCLDIIQRVNIMIDVASALEYLHHGYSSPVVHCDLKPSNVLLDEDMVAHICDFGMAKLLGESESIAQTRTLATIGYIAPEYGLDGLVSTKIDVYSFGIMLMEMLTRKRPTDEMFEGEMSLKRLIKESLPDSAIDIVDSNMLNRGDGYSLKKEHCVTSIMELALQCVNESPEERMTMVEILPRLKNIKAEFLRDS
ncbi:hypothetical protein SADUNF_Sadunf16G0027100 [Salix dunnii]|uniref:non-specific serine/threonine protein kinase n=1 Tax=Salix dunnii TaxID=1413687 RepID=A0A835J8T8_9ROSI|nr:hypothetical protein SADUNF_Sadunf16G0027100 [Salix dunnii]